MILRSEPGVPGAWTVVAAGDVVLALPAEHAGRFDGVAERLVADDGFRVVLEDLVARGIAEAPDFALVDASSDAARVVLRGDAEVEADGDHVVGRGVTTWAERVLGAVRSIVLVVPGSRWVITPGGATIGGAPGGGVGAPATVSTAAAPAAPAPAPAPAPDAVPDPAALIEAAAVRDEPVSQTTLVPGREEPAPGVAPYGDADAEPYAFLFGEFADTVLRTVGEGTGPLSEPFEAGDHDGRTVLVEDLERAGTQGELPSRPAQRGPALVLELPGGVVEPISAPLLVGRSPSDPGHDASGGIPRLIAVAAGDKDISRTHARIEVAGGAVVVTDLGSKNGTSVTLPGGAPRLLRAGEPAVVLPDTAIDLGGGVVMTVREVG